jgi:hypothetical protein
MARNRKNTIRRNGNSTKCPCFFTSRNEMKNEKGHKGEQSILYNHALKHLPSSNASAFGTLLPRHQGRSPVWQTK